MSRTRIPYRSAATIELAHPTDVVADPQNPLDNASDGATSTFKVYDAAKDEVLSVDEAAAETVLSVTGAAVFEVGDVVEVDLDDGTVHDAGALTAVDPGAGTVTATTGLASGASAGRRVRARIGTQVAMTEFGTPRLGTTNWGFQGLLAPNHVAGGIPIDTEINVEITFLGTGTPNGNLELLKVLCLVVKPEADCRDCA